VTQKVKNFGILGKLSMLQSSLKIMKKLRHCNSVENLIIEQYDG